MQRFGKYGLGVMFAIFIAMSCAHAQAPSAQEIIKALLARPDNTGKAVRARGGLLKQLDRRGLARPKAGQRSIDMEVAFEFDSANLTPQAIKALDTLGRALMDERLKRQKIQVIGHTDAKGSDSYNLSLSTKRAHAVISHLKTYYSIDESNLSARGMGESQLRDLDNPEGKANRRVEIRNITPTN